MTPRDGQTSSPAELLAEISGLRLALLDAEQRACIDPLTGLANRRWFDAAMSLAQGHVQREGVAIGIIMLHIDGLMIVNDQDGHETGDGLLLLTAQVLTECSRANDLPARLGGDDFALLVQAHDAQVSRTASRLHDMLSHTGVTASIGWAMCAADGDLDGALRAADDQVDQIRHGHEARQGRASVFQLSARAAIAAQIGQAQAVGIVMQRHQCSAEKAQLEIAFQAFKLDLPVTAIAALLVDMTAGDRLSDDNAARARELTVSFTHALHHETGLAQQSSATPVSRAVDAADPGSKNPGSGDPSSTTFFASATEQPAAAIPGTLLMTTLSLPVGDEWEHTGDLQAAGRQRAASGSAGSGGDWCDAFPLPDGGVALIVGDVSGHDGEAAAVMSEVRTLLRGLAMDRNGPPNRLLERLDRTVTALRLERMTTAILARVDADPAGAMTLRWCNAGHPPPVLLLANGDSIVLGHTGDLLLGLGFEFASQRHNLSVPLIPGSTLLMFTDGLIETRTADLDSGLTRLQTTARGMAHLNVATLSDRLIAAMAGDTPSDDVVLIAVRIPAGPAADINIDLTTTQREDSVRTTDPAGQAVPAAEPGTTSTHERGALRGHAEIA